MLTRISPSLLRRNRTIILSFELLFKQFLHKNHRFGVSLFAAKASLHLPYLRLPVKRN